MDLEHQTVIFAVRTASPLQFSFNAVYDEGTLLGIFNIKPAVSQGKGEGWQLRQGEMASYKPNSCVPPSSLIMS